MKIPQLICKPPAQTQFCIQSWNIKQYAVNHNGEVNFLEHRLTYPFPFSLTTPPHQLSTPSSQHFPRSHSQLFTFPHCWHYITLICSRFFVLFGLYFNTYYSFFTAENLFYCCSRILNEDEENWTISMNCYVLFATFFFGV